METGENGLQKFGKSATWRYTREALTEPINFWGLAGFAVAAAFTFSVIPIVLALILEAFYLTSVPMLNSYRRLVDNRERERRIRLREAQRERLIREFSPREREAVEYLRKVRNDVYRNYTKFTGAKQIPTNLRTLDQRWEDFVDLLDVYRRRKQHLKTINRQVIHNQLSQAFRAAEASPDDRTKRIQQANVEILKRRLSSYDELEKSVKLVEGQLQSIENFFGLVNDQVVSLPTPERVSSLDFEQLSDSIAMTKQMLDATADAMGALDTHNREMGNYELLSSNPR
jgi:hypothetical protein